MPWYDGPPLLSHLERLEIGGDRNLIDFRFPVQLVNRPTHDFRGFCGRVASGVVRVGDEIVVRASGKRTRVKSIVTFEGELPAAVEGQSVTLCLEDEIDISRGDMLCPPRNMPQFTRDVEAMLVWMNETPLRPGTAYIIKHTTRTLRGTVARLRYRVDPDTLRSHPADTLELNEIGRVAIECFQPIAWDPYDSNRATGVLILIDPQTNATVGAGMLVSTGWCSPTPCTATREPAPSAPREQPGEPGTSARLTGAKRPATVWLTGLSGSGKTTVAKAFERAFCRTKAAGLWCWMATTFAMDLNRDLGLHATHDRAENMRAHCRSGGALQRCRA
jgi:bifunctional enzyme CysN/CysC